MGHARHGGVRVPEVTRSTIASVVCAAESGSEAPSTSLCPQPALRPGMTGHVDEVGPVCDNLSDERVFCLLLYRARPAAVVSGELKTQSGSPLEKLPQNVARGVRRLGLRRPMRLLKEATLTIMFWHGRPRKDQASVSTWAPGALNTEQYDSTS